MKIIILEKVKNVENTARENNSYYLFIKYENTNRKKFTEKEMTFAEKIRRYLWKPENLNLFFMLNYLLSRERYETIKDVLKSDKILKSLLKYKEENIFDLLNLIINYDRLDNLIYEKELEDNMYKINFFDGLFTSFSSETIEILKSICKDILDNRNIIQKNKWFEFVENYNFGFNINKKSNTEFDTINIRTVKKFNYKQYAKSLDNSIAGYYLKEEGLDIEDIDSDYYVYTDTSTNEIDLIIKYISIILSMKKIFTIQICPSCKNFFLTQRNDKNRCSKCKKFDNNKIKKFVTNLEKKIYNNINRITSNAEKDNILREKAKIYTEYHLKNRKEMSGKEYLYWLISFYKKDGKTFKIAKANIEKLIHNNKNFEKEFSMLYHK